MIKHQGSTSFQIKEVEYHTVTLTIEGNKEASPGESSNIRVEAECPNQCLLDGMGIVIEAEDGTQTGEYPLILLTESFYATDPIPVPVGNWTAILIGG